MKHDLGKEKIEKLMVKLSIPAILSMLSAALYNLADRSFVGRLNPLGLTAIGITMPIQIVQMAFVLMIGMGSSTLISIYYGREELQNAKKIFQAAIIYIITTLALLTLVGTIFIDDILRLLQVSEQVYPYARDYALILIWGSVPALTGYCLNNTVRALGYAKEAMSYVIYSSLLNILLDAVFIIYFNWGVKGAALATIISESLVTIMVANFFYKNPIRDKENSNIKNNVSMCKGFLEITRNGTPNLFMQTFGTIVSILLNRYVIQYGGDTHMASMTIVASIAQFFLMVVYGLGCGIQPILGYNYGAENSVRIKICLKKALIFVIIYTLLIVMMVEMLPEFLIRIFTSDAALIDISIRNARISLSMLSMVGINSIISTYMQSIKKPMPATLLYVLRYGGILIPALYIFPRIFGIDGVYIARAVSDGLCGLIAILILYTVKV